MNFAATPSPKERPELWPWSVSVDEGIATDSDVLAVDALMIRGCSLREVVGDGREVILIDCVDLEGQLHVWATAFAEEFWDGYGMSGGYVVHIGRADEEHLRPLLDSAGIISLEDEFSGTNEGLLVIPVPGRTGTQERGKWLRLWRDSCAERSVEDISCLRFVETGEEYGSEVSPTVRARELADFLREIYTDIGCRVPRVEYVPYPNLLTHSTLYVNCVTGEVGLEGANVKDLPIVWF